MKVIHLVSALHTALKKAEAENARLRLQNRALVKVAGDARTALALSKQIPALQNSHFKRLAKSIASLKDE